MTGPMHRPTFREDGMSFLDYVRDVLGQPDLPDDEADHILWELTPFPIVSGRDDLRPYLEGVRDGTRTYDSVYADMDAALAAAHPEDDEDETPRTPGVVTQRPTGNVL